MGKYGPKRQAIRRCILGDMRHRIELQVRDIQGISNINDVSYTEKFTTTFTRWSALYTVKGEEIFDGVNLTKLDTHHFIIRRIIGLTEEKWVKYQGRLYDIIDIDDYDERHLFMLIRTRLRGISTLQANQA